MRFIISIIATVSLARGLVLAAPATQPTSPFVFVLIDRTDEESIGRVPFSRTVFVRVIEQAAALRARGVAIKFFLDRPGKDEAVDRALAQAMKKTRVLLQAHIDDAEENPHALADRFLMKSHGEVDPAFARSTLAGKSGWIPLPIFSESAFDVGFVDSPLDDGEIKRVPMLQAYRGTYVQSLWTCCLALAADQHPVIDPQHVLRIGPREVALDQMNCVEIAYPASDELPSMPLREFLQKDLPAEHVRDKLVVIGCDDGEMPTAPTPLGKMNVHLAFCHALLSTYQKLAPSK